MFKLDLSILFKEGLFLVDLSILNVETIPYYLWAVYIWNGYCYSHTHYIILMAIDIAIHISVCILEIYLLVTF